MRETFQVLYRVAVKELKKQLDWLELRYEIEDLRIYKYIIFLLFSTISGQLTLFTEDLYALTFDVGMKKVFSDNFRIGFLAKNLT